MRRLRAHVAIPAAIALGGMIGAVARYAVANAWPAPAGRFPWSTFVVNVSGSICLGFLLRLIVERLPRHRFARPLLCTGLLGGYTTFSTFAVEASFLALERRTHSASPIRSTCCGSVACRLSLRSSAGLAARRGSCWTSERRIVRGVVVTPR